MWPTTWIMAKECSDRRPISSGSYSGRWPDLRRPNLKCGLLLGTDAALQYREKLRPALDVRVWHSQERGRLHPRSWNHLRATSEYKVRRYSIAKLLCSFANAATYSAPLSDISSPPMMLQSLVEGAYEGRRCGCPGSGARPPESSKRLHRILEGGLRRVSRFMNRVQQH